MGSQFISKKDVRDHLTEISPFRWVIAACQLVLQALWLWPTGRCITLYRISSDSPSPHWNFNDATRAVPLGMDAPVVKCCIIYPDLYLW